MEITHPSSGDRFQPMEGLRMPPLHPQLEAPTVLTGENLRSHANRSGKMRLPQFKTRFLREPMVRDIIKESFGVHRASSEEVRKRTGKVIHEICDGISDAIGAHGGVFVQRFGGFYRVPHLRNDYALFDTGKLATPKRPFRVVFVPSLILEKSLYTTDQLKVLTARGSIHERCLKKGVNKATALNQRKLASSLTGEHLPEADSEKSLLIRAFCNSIKGALHEGFAVGLKGKFGTIQAVVRETRARKLPTTGERITTAPRLSIAVVPGERMFGRIEARMSEL